MRRFYSPTHISTLKNKVDHRFGLSHIYKGLICICADVCEDFGLDQADWQSAVSGEEVQIAQENKTAFPWKWTTPLFFLGVELPNYRNNGGSVDRRLFMIEFRKRVANIDPYLLDRFMDDIDLFQRKGVALYHKALRHVGDSYIWTPGVVGKQIRQWRDSVRQTSDILYAFLTCGCFEFNGDFHFPLEDFKTLYQDFRNTNGYDKIRWTRDHFDAIFMDMGLHISNETHDFEGQRRTTMWVIGCAPKVISAD